VAFWRFHGTRERSMGTVTLCVGGLVASLWLALPSGPAIYTGTRMIGESIEVTDVAAYEEMSPRVFAASERLHSLFRPDWDPEVPEPFYGGSPLAWMYYATRPGDHGVRDNYVLADAHHRRDDATEVLRDTIASVFVHSEAQWMADRRIKPLQSLGRGVYRIPRDVLFLRREILDRPGYFSPGLWLAGKLGIDTP